MGNRGEKTVQEFKEIVWSEIKDAQDEGDPIREERMRAIHDAIRYIQGMDSKDQTEEKLEIDMYPEKGYR